MGVFPFCFSELRNEATDARIPFALEFQVNPDYFIPHRHNFIEFTYVTKGCGSEIINNRKHVLKPGTFSLMLPYQVHTLYSEPDNPLSFYVGAISLDAFFGSDGMWGGLDELLLRADGDIASFVNFENTQAPVMEGILAVMYKALREGGLWGELLFKAKLVEALVLFDRTRRGGEFEAGKPRDSQARLDAGFKNDFWSLVYYVQTHYNEHITLKRLSDLFHLSIPYISTSFKKHIGDNYLNFLNEVRIQNACALLVSTEMSITDIAFEVGYESYETFSRVFQKRKGVSAKTYRKSSQ